MKFSSALLAAGLLLGSSAAALAAATPEEAQRLTALFQSYLGKEPGVVSVMPAGESYAARFDFQPLLAKIKEPGVSASLSPIEMTLTPQGGGKWKVDQDQSLSFAVTSTGTLDMKAQIGSLKGTGVFDEAIGTFASSDTVYSQVAIDQVIIEQNQTTRTNYTIAKVTSQTTAAAAGDGVDGSAVQSFEGFRQAMSLPAAADGSTPAMDLTIASPSGKQEMAFSGLKAKALTDLVAWSVAHASPEAVKGAQAELKDKLRAVLPVFSSISGTAGMDEVSINSIAGTFGLAKLGFAIEANGAVADGRLRESFSFEGIKVPAELVPQWASGLVPQKLGIDVSVSGFDLAAPAAKIIDTLDLAKDPPLPEGFENELLPLFMPTGAVTIGLGPSEILSSLYHLKATGEMKAGPADMPQGQATVTLKGLDETSAALQAAPPEMGMQQMAPVILLIKGLAKQEADGVLSWKIESTPTGSVLVNGNDVSKMTGGQ